MLRPIFFIFPAPWYSFFTSIVHTFYLLHLKSLDFWIVFYSQNTTTLGKIKIVSSGPFTLHLLFKFNPISTWFQKEFCPSFFIHSLYFVLHIKFIPWLPTEDFPDDVIQADATQSPVFLFWDTVCSSIQNLSGPFTLRQPHLPPLFPGITFFSVWHSFCTYTLILFLLVLHGFVLINFPKSGMGSFALPIHSFIVACTNIFVWPSVTWKFHFPYTITCFLSLFDFSSPQPFGTFYYSYSHFLF